MGKANKKQTAQIRVAKGAASTINALMAAQGVSKAELARRSGKSTSYISQALNPGTYDKSPTSDNTNVPSINTYAAFAATLGHRLEPPPENSWTTVPDPNAGRLVPKRPNPSKPKTRTGVTKEVKQKNV